MNEHGYCGATAVSKEILERLSCMGHVERGVVTMY